MNGNDESRLSSVSRRDRLDDDDAQQRRPRAVPAAEQARAPDDGGGDRVEIDVELADHYVTTGGQVTEAGLRTRLVGQVQLGTAPDMAQRLKALAENERQLRLHTPHALHDPAASGRAAELRIPRDTAEHELVERMQEIGRGDQTLLVRGEPDVGKSALVLTVIDALRAQGAAVTVLGLRQQLPADVLWPALLSTLPVAPTRLIVLDGCEIVQEQGPQLLVAIVSAAHEAEIGVVAVTRNDAADLVGSALREATATKPQHVIVAPLLVEDIALLIGAFPALARLRGRRSQWLMRRLGLVRLLLAAGDALDSRSGALTETEVFHACWMTWVRRRELTPPGLPGPDAREQMLLHIVRRDLGLIDPYPVPIEALPSLRSDGLLPAASATAAGEHFTDDLVRDLVTTRLLTAYPADVLRGTAAPRWTLRAARVACQTALRPADGSAEAQAFLRQVDAFASLAVAAGDRWAEVPWEALLTSGLTADLLRAAAVELCADRGRHLRQLQRVALQHFCPGGRADDPIVVEPLVDWLFTNGPSLPGWSELPSQIHARTAELTVAWLRGVATITPLDEETAAARRRLGHLIVAQGDLQGDLLEVLTLLGPEFETDRHTHLRHLATFAPSRLTPVVDRSDAADALAALDVALLAELTLAYYTLAPRTTTRARDFGIRDHEHHSRPGDRRQGPFQALLTTDPRYGLTVITRLLAHAAIYSEAWRSRQRGSDPAGLTIDVLGLGERRYRGDEEIYSHYRGSLTGPGPCITALLACERWMDQCVAAGNSIRRVATAVLARAEDLAILGLVTGFLVRHLDLVTDELDAFLSCRALWELESARVGDALHLPTRGNDPDTPGQHRRQMDFPAVTEYLINAALRRSDHAALDRLRAAGRRLVDVDPGTSEDDLRIVRLDASRLDSAHYIAVTTYAGTVYEFREPPAITDALSADREASWYCSVWAGLFNRHALTLQPPFLAGVPVAVPVSILRRDISMARDLLTDPEQATLRNEEAATMVAASTLRFLATASATSTTTMLSADEIAWAAGRVLDAARCPPGSSRAHADQRYPWGGDRSAAMTLPHLALVDLSLPQPIDPTTILAAIGELMTSPSVEVRRYTAIALRRVWTTPCDPDLHSCRHRAIWIAVVAASRDTVRTRTPDGRRPFTTVPDPVADSLRAVDTSAIDFDRLVPVLASSLAAPHTACATPDIEALRDVLVDVSAGVLADEADEFGTIHHDDLPVAAAALLAHHVRDVSVLPRFLTTLRQSTAAVIGILDALCQVATYDPSDREQLSQAWPLIFAAVFPDPDARITSRDRGSFWGALIPMPQPDTSDPHASFTSTLDAARVGWPTAGDLAQQIDSWIPRAVGTWEPIVRLVGLLEASPRDQQIGLGLTWLTLLITPDNDADAPGPPRESDGRIVVEFLVNLRTQGSPPGPARIQYDSILDILATHDVRGARHLQQQDEQ